MSIGQSVDPRVQHATRFSQFFEVLFLLCLVLVVCGYLLIDKSAQFWLWTITWLGIAMASFLLAVRYQIVATRTFRATRFDFSPNRLNTLKVVRTPADVMVHLQTLVGREFEGEGVLFAELDGLMGRERCSEVRATVFKYTKVD